MNKEIECFEKLRNMRILKNDVLKIKFYEKQFLKEELKINNEMIDFNEKDWLDIINRLLNFLMKKYPTLKSDFDFKVMDNKKVVRCAYMTKNLHLADYKMSYWKGVKTKYKELNEAWEFMLETLARFNVIQECAYSDKLKMDTKERATIRTVITKFNKTLRPKITTFLQENNI